MPDTEELTLPRRENAVLQYFRATKKRSTNIELLRFLAIGLILIGHCCVFSGYDPGNKDTFGHCVFYFHDMLSQVGNGLFITILCFFLFSDSSASKPVWKRMLSLYLPCLFYSLLLYGIYQWSGRVPTENMTKQAFWPVLYNNYWFVRAYLLFLVIYPFYYKMLMLMSKKQHLVLMVVFFLSIMAIGRHGDKLWGFIGACEFLCYFTIIGFFKRIHPQKPKRWYLWFPLAIVSLLSLFGYVCLCGYVPAMNKYQSWMNNCVSLIVLPATIVTFYAFYSLPEFHCGTINYLAKCTFGIYLINGHTCSIGNGLNKLIRFYGNGKADPIRGIMMAWLIFYAVGLASEMIRIPAFDLGHKGYVILFNKIKKGFAKKSQENEEQA